jgi:DNA polymerase III delta subunit
MIYIIHGDDVSKSRALIVNQHKKLGDKNKVEIAIKDISPQQLYERAISTGLFGDTPFIVLDVTEAGRADVTEYVEMLKKIPSETTMVVFSTKSLPKTNAFISYAVKTGIKILECAKVADANIFRFVDALFSKNRVDSYKQLSKLLDEDYDVYYIFAMVLYGLRNIAKVLWNAPSSANLKPFQADKTKAQLAKFSREKITNLFVNFLILEKQAKTGSLTPETFITLAVEKVLNS